MKLNLNLNKVRQSRRLFNNLNIVSQEIETNLNLKPKTQNESFKFNNMIRETLDNSVAHAIIKIVETPIFSLRVFLFLCVILSSGLCSYLIIELTMSFLSYGVSTTSRTLYETPAPFPKVTVCNVNPFTTKYAMEFLKEINKEVYPYIDIFNDDQMSKEDLKVKLDLINAIKFKAIFKMNVLNETEKRKLSRPLEEILLNNDPNSFLWFFDPWYGNCWMFNSGYNQTGHKVPLHTNNFPGETYGLNLNFYVNFYQNLTTINSSPFLGGGHGALVRIDNSTYLTYYISMDGIKLEPGHMTSISLSRKFKSNLPQPYSNCLIDNETNAGFHSELFDLIQNSEYRYTHSLCFFQCLQRGFLLECNCTDAARVSLFANASKCIKNDQLECTNRIWNQQNEYLLGNCSSECPLECYSNSFDVSLSSYELIPKYYMEYLNSKYTNLSDDFPIDKIDAETARKSFVCFSIFYHSLTFDISTESPQMTLITLFANIGGHLGLFMGVSVFSLFEPIQVLIEIIYIKFYKK